MLVDVAVLVQLLGGGDVRVAEDELDVAGLHAEGLQQRGGSVAGLVHGDAAKPGLLDQELEGARKVARLNGVSGLADEDEVMRETRVAVRRGGTEALPDVGKQREGASSGVGLDGAGDQFALHALDLLTHLDDPFGQVDVLPAQAEYLAAAHAVGEQELEAEFPLVAFRGAHECLCVCEGPRLDLFRRVLREVDQARDVAVDQLIAQSTVERRGQHHASLLNGARADTAARKVVDGGLELGDGELLEAA